MAEMTHEDIERLWNSVTHFIPDRQKQDAAVDFVRALDDVGIEHKEIESIGEYDPVLENAVETVFEDYEEDDEVYDDRYNDD